MIKDYHYLHLKHDVSLLVVVLEKTRKKKQKRKEQKNYLKKYEEFCLSHYLSVPTCFLFDFSSSVINESRDCSGKSSLSISQMITAKNLPL